MTMLAWKKTGVMSSAICAWYDDDDKIHGTDMYIVELPIYQRLPLPLRAMFFVKCLLFYS